MGTNHNVIIGPRDGAALPLAEFTSLVRDVFESGWVIHPAIVFGGPIDSFCLAAPESLIQAMGDPDAGERLYEGVALPELLTIVEVAFGKSDLCVAFEALNHAHPEIARWLEEEAACSGAFGLYALTGRREVAPMDFEDRRPLTLQVFAACDARGGPQSMISSPFGKLLGTRFPQGLMECVGRR